MAFELFQETGARNEDFISVTRIKSFGLSRAFLDKHMITPLHKAVLFFDPDTQRIAIHFTLSDTKIGFKVQVSNDKHGGTIKAKSFFDIKGIDSAKYAGRYGDYEEVKLEDLGNFNKSGTAFVLTLKESKDRSHFDARDVIVPTPDSVVDDLADLPINLDDIQF